MAITAFANNAAAVAAGYAIVQTDKGASFNPRYFTRFEKWLSGPAGDAGHLMYVLGESNASQAAADTVALNSLNARRKHYYGGAPSRPDGATTSAGGRGGTHTDDVT